MQQQGSFVSGTGRFITFEGIDGAGKSSQIAAVRTYLEQQGKTVLCTREPGGTFLGEQLRALLLSHDMAAETEALLMFAARNEHLVQCIEPALAAGQWVISDRFSDATYAYQSGGRGLCAAKCEALEQWVHPARQPDQTFLFDLPPALAAQRLRQTEHAADRFEQEPEVFFERVRQAYLERASQASARFYRVDATASAEVIRARLIQQLQQRFFA